MRTPSDPEGIVLRASRGAVRQTGSTCALLTVLTLGLAPPSAATEPAAAADNTFSGFTFGSFATVPMFPAPDDDLLQGFRC